MGITEVAIYRENMLHCGLGVSFLLAVQLASRATLGERKKRGLIRWRTRVGRIMSSFSCHFHHFHAAWDYQGGVFLGAALGNVKKGSCFRFYLGYIGRWLKGDEEGISQILSGILDFCEMRAKWGCRILRLTVLKPTRLAFLRAHGFSMNFLCPCQLRWNPRIAKELRLSVCSL